MRTSAAGSYSLEVQTTPGNGGFTLRTTLTTGADLGQSLTIDPGSQSGAMAIGDFNSDGIPDLAAPDGIHLGLGGGTFQGPSQGLDLPISPSRITSMVAGDFTDDGKLDLAIAFAPSSNTGARHPDGGVFVLLGNGNGTFQTPIYYAAGDNPASLVVGDFTGDGEIDLAVADKGEEADGYVNAGISVLLGIGQGTFRAAQELIEPGYAPQALVAGDFKGDGKPELAVANAASGNSSGDVSIFRVAANGTLHEEGSPIPVGQSPSSLATGDFNGDDKLDLAVANYASNNVSVLLGNGEGTFQLAKNYPVGGGPLSLITGDFTGDGRPDLAVVDSTSDAVSLLLGNGNGLFQQAKQTVLGFTPCAIVDGFFSGDGLLDLAIANSVISDGSGTVSILLGNGDGTFHQPSVGDLPTPVVAGDFNGDGNDDLATANPQSDEVSILLGEGDGSFHLAERIALDIRPTAIVAGDFAGDGRLDLAVTGTRFGNGSGAVAILLGNGNGTFRPASYYSVGEDPTAVVAGDFSGDGTLDLAVTNADSDSVSILMGNGDGTFGAASYNAVGADPTAIVAGDFNGDGRLDLAVADEGLQVDGRTLVGG